MGQREDQRNKKELRRIPEELMPGRRHPHRLHDESYQIVNLPIAVTCTVRRRSAVLVNSTAHIVAQTLLAASDRRSAELLAYCVMPDHLHFVAHLDADDTPPKFRRYFKGEAARRINVAWRRPGAFRWQRSYWDSFATDAEAVEETVAYMLDNPVRWELCDMAEDWPFSADLR